MSTTWIHKPYWTCEADGVCADGLICNPDFEICVAEEDGDSDI